MDLATRSRKGGARTHFSPQTLTESRSLSLEKDRAHVATSCLNQVRGERGEQGQLRHPFDLEESDTTQSVVKSTPNGCERKAGKDSGLWERRGACRYFN